MNKECPHLVTYYLNAWGCTQVQVTTHLGVVRKDCTTSSAPCTDGTVSGDNLTGSTATMSLQTRCTVGVLPICQGDHSASLAPGCIELISSLRT